MKTINYLMPFCICKASKVVAIDKQGVFTRVGILLSGNEDQKFRKSIPSGLHISVINQSKLGSTLNRAYMTGFIGRTMDSRLHPLISSFQALIFKNSTANAGIAVRGGNIIDVIYLENDITTIILP